MKVFAVLLLLLLFSCPVEACRIRKRVVLHKNCAVSLSRKPPPLCRKFTWHCLRNIGTGKLIISPQYVPGSSTPLPLPELPLSESSLDETAGSAIASTPQQSSLDSEQGLLFLSPFSVPDEGSEQVGSALYPIHC